jgi:serine/threonine-protein kinase
MKPENVLVPKEGYVRVIDFDLSVPKPDRPKKLRRVSGTPAYLAPELIAEQVVDERTDIFAFGVLAYKMLTGREPLGGHSRKEMLAKYADYRQHFVPPRRHNPRISPALEKIILNCLQKEVMRRYPTMSLVLRDLQMCGEIPLAKTQPKTPTHGVERLSGSGI